MKHIVIIDDDKDMRMYLNIYLSKFYSTSTFEDPIAALEAMKINPPDLVILDISMPAANGREILQQIRNSTQLNSLPVIAVTGYGFEEERKTFLEEGFDACFAKPLEDEDEFLKAIHKLIHGKH